MSSIEFEDGAIQVDAAVVAAGLAITPDRLLDYQREGKVTSLCESGVDADSGRYRLTFFYRNRRFSLTIDARGAILQRSVVDFGEMLLPTSARRIGR